MDSFGIEEIISLFFDTSAFDSADFFLPDFPDLPVDLLGDDFLLDFSDGLPSGESGMEFDVSSETDSIPDSSNHKSSLGSSLAFGLASGLASHYSPRVIKAVVKLGKYLTTIKSNPAGNKPQTVANDPVMREMDGVLESQTPDVVKAQRMTIYDSSQPAMSDNNTEPYKFLDPLQRVILDKEPEFYKTELRNEAFKLDGTFHKLGDLRSKLLRYVFSNMEKHEKDLDDLSFFSLDFPYPLASGKNLYTRVRKYVGSDKLYYYNIQQKLGYCMQPMFPRFVFNDGTMRELPNEWRLEIITKLREVFKDKYHKTHKGPKIFGKKPYFTKQERRLILAYLEVKQMSLQQQGTILRKIRERMLSTNYDDKGNLKDSKELKQFSQDTIRKYWTNIDKKMVYAFRTAFLPKQLGVDYWLEMGLYFDPL